MRVNRVRLAFSVPFLMFCAAPAQANTGAPLLAYILFEPVMWFALIAIVIVEMRLARRIIGVTGGRALAIAAAANGVSTLIGVPLTWLIYVPNANLREAAFFGAVFLIPSFFISVFSERWVARLFLDREKCDAVRRWSWRANLTTYEGLLALLLIVALYDRFGPG